jgi:pre-mRNA-splicing factor SYF1
MAANVDGAAAAAAAAAAELKDLLPGEADLLYEEELLRNPYNLKMWARYLDARKAAAPRRRALLYERALRALPGSYKLWRAYLRERADAAAGLPPGHPALDALADVYERALVTMHKMPRIWAEFLEFLTSTRRLTRTRRAFDRALMALPVTQHERVWPLYLRFISLPGVPEETAVRVYRRYLRLEPGHAEEFIAYLKGRGRWGEAARRLAAAVDDEGFRSLEGKSRHALWLELCELVTRHPRDVGGLDVEATLRAGIRRFTDEVGRLWCALADFHIRRGAFERARDVYEEGIASVATVRDFSLVFDALTQFEESLISARMEQEAEEGGEEGGAEAAEDNDGTDFVLRDAGDDLDLRLARLEALVERRPELLSSVVLRQNPHNVGEWHKRAALFKGDPAKQILCYTEAVRTVDVEKAVGKPHTLWLAFAKLYEEHGDLANARVVFEKAAAAPARFVDDLAALWAERVEAELRAKNFRRAVELAQAATAAPARPRARADEAGLPPCERLYRSPRLWGLRCDLEESLGTPEGVRAAYAAAMDLKVASVQMVLNYAEYLREDGYHEEAFAAYERGVALFRFPHAADLWRAYLTAFVARYGGKKVERARDLFRQACAAAPPAAARPFYLQFAAFEEAHGLARSAMAVYEAAVRAVPPAERAAVYEVYVARASEFFGVAKVREVYEAALEAEVADGGVLDGDARAMALRYAALEARLGEADRARGIYVHAAAIADPRVDKAFWQAWHDFEVRHGGEESFREMLRVRRSVAASFSQQHFNTAVIDAAAVAAGPPGGSAGAGKRKLDDMAALEAELDAAAPPPAADGFVAGTKVRGFVSAGVIQQGGGDAPTAPAPAPPAANAEEIELGGDEEDEGEEEGGAAGADPAEVELEERAVPDAVFGGLAKKARVEGA